MFLSVTYQVELDGTLVTKTSRGSTTLHLSARVQAPGAVHAVKVDNCTQVVVQSNVDEQTAGDTIQT